MENMIETASPKITTPNIQSIEEVYNLISSDMEAVNTLIKDKLYSDVVLINQLSHYIINSGGKRLRPIMLLLSANAFGYRGDKHINLAAVVEFIHTATLLHDDVVDASEKRRGNLTANAIWGNEASVLVGDFLYSRAFQMMVEANDMRIMEILANATNTIAEGEVLQLLNCNDPDTDEKRYLDVIRFKTAKLFEAASQLGTVLVKASPEAEKAMAQFGMFIGTAFQLIDDVLDYSASADEIGKNIGDDLAEGKPTLPLIRVMNVGTAKQKETVRNAILNGGLDLIDDVKAAIELTDALEYTTAKARDEADKALAMLEQAPASPYKDALFTLAEFSIHRTY